MSLKKKLTATYNRCKRQLASVKWPAGAPARTPPRSEEAGNEHALLLQVALAVCRVVKTSLMGTPQRPPVITRYNNYRSVTINGSPALGVASSTAFAAMADVSAKTLPHGFGLERTGTAFQEQRASGQTGGSFRDWRCVRLPVHCRAVRELDRFLSRCCCRSWSLAGGLRGHHGGRVDARSLRPDRPDRADCDGGEERHPDRRVRQGRTRAGPEHQGRGRARRKNAPPRGDDDRVPRRPGAAGMGRERFADRRPLRQHAGVRRHAGVEHHRTVRHPMLYVVFQSLRERTRRKPQAAPTPHAQAAE